MCHMKKKIIALLELNNFFWLFSYKKKLQNEEK